MIKYSYEFIKHRDKLYGTMGISVYVECTTRYETRKSVMQVL